MPTYSRPSESPPTAARPASSSPDSPSCSSSAGRRPQPSSRPVARSVEAGGECLSIQSLPVRDRSEQAEFTAVLLTVCLCITVFPGRLDWVPFWGGAADPIALVPLMPLIAMSVVTVVRHRRGDPPDIGAVALLGIAALLTLSFFVHPSIKSHLVLISAWGAWAVATSISRLSESTFRWLLLLLVVLGCIESLIALAQRVTGRNVGLGWLGESPVPFSPGPRGTMAHSYVLCAFSLVILATVSMCVLNPRFGALTSRWSVGLAALPSIGVGLSSSRAGALGLLAICACLVVSLRSPFGRKRTLTLLVAIGVGFLVPAAVWSGGWTNKVSSAQMRDVTSGRMPLIHQSLHLILTHPFFGVGPGRYVDSLEREESPAANHLSATNVIPVHNVPLLAGAEAGVLALALSGGLLVLVGLQAKRHGPLTLGLFAALVPFYMLDPLLYNIFQGAVILGIWIGLLGRFCAQPRLDSDEGPTISAHLSTGR